MTETSWEDAVDPPDELDDDAEEQYEGAFEVNDMAGEGYPYPQGEVSTYPQGGGAKAMQGLAQGDLLGQESDQVSSTENVQNVKADRAWATVQKGCAGPHRTFLGTE